MLLLSPEPVTLKLRGSKEFGSSVPAAPSLSRETLPREGHILFAHSFDCSNNLGGNLSFRASSHVRDRLADKEGLGVHKKALSARLLSLSES